MKFKTINPATEEIIAEYETMPQEEVMRILNHCSAAFKSWSQASVPERLHYFRKLAEVLRNNKESYARLITTEMGRPLKDAIAEIEKCALTVDVYTHHAEAWLADEKVEAADKNLSILYQPLGVILAVMPWNFPFWQALRFAIPTLIAGNTAVLKHSNQVPQCALAIEECFQEAGFPENVFRTVIADHETTAALIASDLIAGISLTGSTAAGSRIAETAGRYLKKVVLELGGSDPFIVLDDADLGLAVNAAVTARMNNAGQSCISAKRFIVDKKVADAFSEKFAEAMAKLKVGNPFEHDTQVGPLVNADGLEQIEAQVADAVQKGAKVLAGGKRVEGKGYFYQPTVLINVNRHMNVIKEEVFGPVAPVIVVNDEDEAVKVANDSEFGLGGSVWTKDLGRGARVARQIEAGSVAVNIVVRSDPRMPFGGIKKSGIGRELSHFGLREFTNIKGLTIAK